MNDASNGTTKNLIGKLLFLPAVEVPNSVLEASQPRAREDPFSLSDFHRIFFKRNGKLIGIYSEKIIILASNWIIHLTFDHVS